MRVRIDEIACQGCGVCEATAPDVFSVGDDGISHVLVDVVPADLERDVRDAVHGCPTEAISVAE